jgi:glutathione S-transferase
MSLELFLIDGSPYAWRVQLALAHKQLAYQTRTLSLSAGDLRADDFRALNPRGRVPVLRAGDLVLYESLAILAYLERAFPARPIFGRTAAETGAICQQISEYTSYVDGAVEAFILPIYFGRAEEAAAEIRGAIATLAGELARYERVLGASAYLAGSEPTAADFVVFPHLQSVVRAGGKPAASAFAIPFLPLAGGHPAVTAWMRRIEAMPGYDATYPPNWR